MVDGTRRRRGEKWEDPPDDMELEPRRTRRKLSRRTPCPRNIAITVVLGLALVTLKHGHFHHGNVQSAQVEIDRIMPSRSVDESGQLRRTKVNMVKDHREKSTTAIKSFPPACRWDCYLSRNKDLSRKLNHTEEAALGHWRESGLKSGRKCSCKEDEKVGSGKDPKSGQPQNQSKGKGALEKGDKRNKKVKSFPPGCSWECYLSRYEDLSRKLKHTEKAALKHYVEVGARKGRKCSCLSPGAKEDLTVPSENAKRMPIFNSAVSPDSSCHSVKKGSFKYCKKVNCMAHEKDVDEKLLQTALGRRAEREGGEEASGGCKMLWFSALHENDSMICKRKWKAYSVFYSVALESALLNAPDALQPVLVLGRYGMPNENSTEHKKFGAWAERKGVKVIYSPRLSFQEHVDRALPSAVKRKQFSERQGTFLRLDIPHFVSQHKLLDIPGVCKKYVLWTDADAIFANKINQKDIRVLSELTGDSLMMFGREGRKKAHLQNAGVIVMNIEKFTEELPKFHVFSRAHPHNYFNVQRGLINSYMNAGNKDKFQLLPLHYNWPPYWQVEPSSFSQIKIIHTHGPKPGRYIEEIAVCDKEAYDSNRFLKHLKKSYIHLFKQGVCCDQGRTAKWTLDAFRQLRASINQLC